MLRWLLILGVVLSSGCDDGSVGADGGRVDTGVADAGSGDTGVIDANFPDAGSEGVGGIVRYEDRPFDSGGFTGEIVPTAARAVAVELWVDGAEVARTRTDDAGLFVFPDTGLSPGAAVMVRALADTAVGDHHARVQSPRTPVQTYAVEVAARVGDGDVQLLARYEDGLGGAFNMADAAYRAFVVYAPHVGAAGPTLTFAWERGYAFPCSSCYDSDDDEISIGGQFDDTDEYDDDIVLHELGHYFVEHYSRDTSPGGSHRDRQVTPEHAYGEGLAYFFAAMIDGSEVIVDTYEGSLRVTDIERVTLGGATHDDFLGTSTGGLGGDLREEIVAGVLWDAFDPASSDEAFDRVALGASGQLEILVDVLSDRSLADHGASGVDLADFLHALECNAGVATANVQSLADDRGFPYVAGGGC
ncbi:MAG: hypothetical protein JRH11_17225 [Deltaproteobacteria bacterium]|nr:hypothetical protein [Deltaproteobacteria bacterium]